MNHFRNLLYIISTIAYSPTINLNNTIHQSIYHPPVKDSSYIIAGGTAVILAMLLVQPSYRQSNYYLAITLMLTGVVITAFMISDPLNHELCVACSRLGANLIRFGYITSGPLFAQEYQVPYSKVWPIQLFTLTLCEPYLSQPCNDL